MNPDPATDGTVGQAADCPAMSMSPIPLVAGFECADHRRSDGVRIDLVAQTGHDMLVEQDYALVARHGMRIVRTGIRWYHVEAVRGRYDWRGVDAAMEAAAKTGVMPIWDLLHFGFPDWVNPWHPDFPAIFAELAGELARRVGSGGHYCPVNEISFMAWAAGDVGYIYPYGAERGGELKFALCDASLRAIRAIRAIDPESRIMSVDPLIAVRPRQIDEHDAARALDESQFEALDMLLGRNAPQLGGSPDMIDIIGVNHYPQSQWWADRATIDWRGPDWTPLGDLLRRVHHRYGKPIMLSETGCEGDARAEWFMMVADACRQAQQAGARIEGICLYPILSHHAWTGERWCPNGMFDGDSDARTPHQPLVDAIARHRTGG